MTTSGPAGKRDSRPLRPLTRGRYADFRPIGEGGMGVVYLALDTDLNRQVAFKIVRPAGTRRGQGPTTPFDVAAPDPATPAGESFEELRGRFLREATVTGLMEHPGVIPVYELGQTEGGVPYYTMRYVRGSKTLRQAMDAAKTPEERLALLDPFLRVCDTLAYAHAHGIMHRDLKPENVALGEYGEVIVLDWGLAKVRGRPTDESRGTVVRLAQESSGPDTIEGLMGTPGYMAPEAALGDADHVDERSDVYGLGVVLFELLTGRLPFDVKDAMQWIARATGEDPPRARSFASWVPPGLDDLVAAAIARDREKRIPNAVDLADRVRAWQRASAVERETEAQVREAEAALAAAQESSGEAMSRHLDRAVAAAGRALERRGDHPAARDVLERVAALRDRAAVERERAVHRRMLTRGAAVVGVAAAVVAFFVVRTLDERRREAEGAATRAQAAEATAKSELARADRERTRADQAAADAQRESKAALDAKAEAVRESKAALEAKTGAEAERAKALAAEERAKGNLSRAESLLGFLVFNVRDALQPLGRLGALEAVARKSLEYFDGLPPESLDDDTLRRKGVALDILGDVLDDRGDKGGALEQYRLALGIGETIAAKLPDSTLAQHDLMVDHNKIGALYEQKGDLDAALAEYRTSLDILRKILAKEPDEAAWVHSMSITQLDIGGILTAKGDAKGAASALDEALAAAKRLHQKDANDARAATQVASIEEALAKLWRTTGEKEKALAAYRSAIDSREGLVARDPANATWASSLASARASLAGLLEEMEKPAEALASDRARLAIEERLAASDATNTTWRRRVAAAREDVARLLEEKGEKSESVTLRRKAVGDYEALVEALPDDLDAHGSLDAAYVALADAFTAAGAPESALEVERTALAHSRALAEKHADVPELRRDVSVGLNRLGHALLSLGKAAEAVAAHAEATAIMEALLKQNADRPGFEADEAFARWKHGMALAATPSGKSGKGREEARAEVEQALLRLKLLVAQKRLPEGAAGWPAEVEKDLSTLK